MNPALAGIDRKAGAHGIGTAPKTPQHWIRLLLLSVTHDVSRATDAPQCQSWHLLQETLSQIPRPARRFLG